MTSLFNPVEMGPPIEVFQLTKLYNECQHPDKVNLGVGAYRTEEGKSWVLPVVMAAEMQMANDRTLNHEYLPVSGLPDFRDAAIKVLLGSNHKVITENRVAAFQSLGGTGALRLAAAFLKDILHYDTVYVSSPTWGNHKGLFKRAGFSNIKEYRYWNEDVKDFNLSGMLEDLSAVPEKSVVILHAVAHNPTGNDPTKEQWESIFKVCKEKNVFVLMDVAYQGFASGNLEEDGWAVRYFADQDIDMFIAQSFSKNFGLYNERVGCLAAVSKDGKKLPEIGSQMEWVIRTMYSNPSNHGARIVATVLNNKAYFEDWKDQIMSMASRVKKMRQELVENLKKLGTPGSWDHITKQIGMFSYTGLTSKQVEYMKAKYIFLLGSGRINLCALNSKNIGYVAKTIDEAVRTHPTLHLTAKAGVPGKGKEVESFAELARRKLQETLNDIISTGVTIDGVMHKAAGESRAHSVEFRFEDEIDFVKIKIKGSMSEISTPETTRSGSRLALESESFTESQKGRMEDKLTGTSDLCVASNDDDMLSALTQPGTLRSSVKTFSSRGVQTTVEGGEPAPKAIPARFQGTMVTPVYFDGLMMTPERLEALMRAAMSRNENVAIPVEFRGGMMTTTFKSLLENTPHAENVGNEGKANEKKSGIVKVKFEGRLQGILDPDMCKDGIPALFDGKMFQN